MPTVRNLATYEERLAQTERGRIAARFKHAKDRVERIAGGSPPLTAAMRAELAGILLAPAGDGDE